jgi:DNA polymerase IV
LSKIPGVGKVTCEKLNTMGLYSCADIRLFPYDELIKRFGKFGAVIWARSHGEDERELQTDRLRKSVGVERTLAQDINTLHECQQMIESLFPMLKKRLLKSNPELHIQSQGIKLKFSDFQQTTVEHRCKVLTKSYFEELLRQALGRQQNRGIRLVGLHVGLAPENTEKQLSFDFKPIVTQ